MEPKEKIAEMETKHGLSSDEFIRLGLFTMPVTDFIAWNVSLKLLKGINDFSEEEKKWKRKHLKHTA